MLLALFGLLFRGTLSWWEDARYSVVKRQWGQTVEKWWRSVENKRGQATLSFILLVGGVVIEMAIAASFVAYLLATSGYGERLSARAFTAAEAGVRDVHVRLARDKEFAQIGPVTYSVAVGADRATVTVSRNTSDATSYLYHATSTGQALARKRRLVGIIVVNRTTGLIQTQSVSEKPF